MKNVIALMLIGFAVYSATTDGSPLIPNGDKEFVTPNAPVPDAAIKIKVQRLADGLVMQGPKIRGLFAAVAQEIKHNANLSSTQQVAKLNEKAFSRYLPMAGFKPVPGLGERLDNYLLEGIQTDQLTPETRAILFDRYMALEWLAQGGPE